MGEEQIFTNVFDFLDVAIALAKKGRSAIANLPVPAVALEQMPAVRQMVEKYDNTGAFRLLARRNINGKIKNHGREIVKDMQKFKNAFDVKNDIIDANTVNTLIDKYREYPAVTELQSDFICQKRVNPGALIRENILNRFLFTDYAREIQFADSLNLTKNVKPLHIVYMDCIRASRENVKKRVEDKISGLKHHANMNGTALDENKMEKLTNELKAHQNVIRKVEKRILNYSAVRSKSRVAQVESVFLTKKPEKVKPSAKLKAASLKNTVEKRQNIKSQKVKL